MPAHMLHPQGQPSHFTMSRGLAALGRGNDTQLVHMSNSEVAGLKHLAKATGGHLTTNPHTGLYEAGALDSILPLIAGGILSMTGVGAPAAAAIVGAEEAVRKKNWKAGLAAGLGAYGGAGLAGSLAGSGAAAAADAGAGAATSPAATATSTAIPSASGAGYAAESAGTNAAQEAAAQTMTTAQRQAAEEAIRKATMEGGNASLNQLQSQWANVKGGLGTLDTMQGWNDLGSNVGKSGLLAMSAPAIYQSSQPAGPSPPTSSKYATTTYDPRTQTYGPLTYRTWTDVGTGSGYASGGFVPAGGGSSNAQPIAQPPSQDAIRNYYNSLMQPPTSGTPITPPLPDANNQYMQNLNTNLALNQHIGGHPVTPTGSAPSLPPPGSTGIQPSGGGTTTPQPTRMVGVNDPYMTGIRSGLFRGFDAGGSTSVNYPTYDPTTGKIIYPDKPSTAPNLDNLAHPASFFKSTLEHPFDVMGNIENRPNTAATVLDPLGILNQDGSFNSKNFKADLKEIPHIASLGLFAQGGIASLPARHIQGPGDGMSDSIPARIDGKQEAALGNDEFVVPADVVSHIGNGSSDAGAKKLYAMMDRIRQARTGKKGQAPQIKAERFMPA